MIDKGKQNILGVGVDAVDYEAAVARIIAAARDRRSMAVTALAVHGVMTGVLDATQRYRLNHLDMVVPDGQPVRWALNRLYNAQLPDRVYGPTLTLKLCEQAAREGLQQAGDLGSGYSRLARCHVAASVAPVPRVRCD